MSGWTQPSRNVCGAGDWEDRRSERKQRGTGVGQTIRLHIDVACRADHQASCADGAGEFCGRAGGSGPRRATWSGCGPRCPRAPSHGGAGADPQRMGAPGGVAAGPGGEGGPGAARAVGRPAGLLQQAHENRPPRLRIRARLPLVHPDGVPRHRPPGPAEPLLRAVRLRSSLVKRRTRPPPSASTPSWSSWDRYGPTCWGPVTTPRAPWPCWSAMPIPRRQEAGPQGTDDPAHPGQCRGAWREAKADELLVAAGGVHRAVGRRRP